MVICLGGGADLHMAQLILLPLTVSCSSKSSLVLPLCIQNLLPKLHLILGIPFVSLEWVQFGNPCLVHRFAIANHPRWVLVRVTLHLQILSVKLSVCGGHFSWYTDWSWQVLTKRWQFTTKWAWSGSHDTVVYIMVLLQIFVVHFVFCYSCYLGLVWKFIVFTCCKLKHADWASSVLVHMIHCRPKTTEEIPQTGNG